MLLLQIFMDTHTQIYYLFFANKLPQYLDALYYAYADDADGVSPLYNLARLMVLVDSNADQELLHLVSKNESACVYTFIALKNNFDQSDIKSLMGTKMKMH
ncbi:hypothetical protein [Yersinia enterocolitica]|uniref:hypothetical protein n=1 Tax=Yersinia enterocolitica TaxID=630 RepID=UPI0002FE31CD|nr:hypothetical protein [Yersinia enterocolitica]